MNTNFVYTDVNINAFFLWGKCFIFLLKFSFYMFERIGT